MTELPMRRFTGRDGVALAYREIGEGRPLVLFHGATGSAAQWRDHGGAVALAERGHRVILPDLRGHGDSAAPRDPARYPPDVLADDGLALLDHLGLTDDHAGYDLGGYSLGGRVALRLLARGARPGRAVVAGQGLASVRQPAGESGMLRDVLTALAEGEALPPGSPEAEQAYWITLSGNDPVAVRHVLDARVPTSDAELARISTPVLVAIGDRDPGRSSADALAAALPAARLVEVPGDHFTAMGSSALTAAIAAFLA